MWTVLVCLHYMLWFLMVRGKSICSSTGYHWLLPNQCPIIVDCYGSKSPSNHLKFFLYTVHTFKLGQVNSFLIVLRYNYWKRKILTTSFIHSRNNLVFIYTGFVKVVWPQFSKLSISYFLWYIICRSWSCQ